VRFRQPTAVHDFLRDSVRGALMLARPAASFLGSLETNAVASSVFTPTLQPDGTVFNAEDAGSAGIPESEAPPQSGEAAPFVLQEKPLPPQEVPLEFQGEGIVTTRAARRDHCGYPVGDEPSVADEPGTLHSLHTLRALGQIRDSFILAVNEQGLWIIDQHVAHERVLFEKLLREREVEQVQKQRLLLPMLIELLPEQMVVFADLAAELERNGFEVEPFGTRTLAVKAAPTGLEGKELERMLQELLEQSAGQQRANLDTLRARIAASIACHAAIKVNMRLDPAKIDWLLAELARTDHPTNCPHGRPIVLRYSYKEIQKAFSRI
jgi:DNA mismatch repair protein MutL